jgi:hypothetical protein
MGYFRYTYDILLIIFNIKKTPIENMLTEFNALHSSITFTVEETNNFR